MITFETLKFVREMTTHLVFCQISYFIKHYKMIAIDLSKLQVLNVDPKAIQQINFTGNLSGNNNNRVMFFIIEDEKKKEL